MHGGYGELAGQPTSKQDQPAAAAAGPPTPDPPWRCPPPQPSRSALPSAAPWPPCRCAASALGRGRRCRAPVRSCWAARWPRHSWCSLLVMPRPCRRAAAAPPRPQAPPHLRPRPPGAGTAPSPAETPSDPWWLLCNAAGARLHKLGVGAIPMGAPLACAGGASSGCSLCTPLSPSNACLHLSAFTRGMGRAGRAGLMKERGGSVGEVI